MAQNDLKQFIYLQNNAPTPNAKRFNIITISLMEHKSNEVM